jgi:hypothetical protein
MREWSHGAKTRQMGARPATLSLVPDETRPFVAIRSLRPYDTEEAFLAQERDTLSRTAVTLIGAPSRPRGVVIRFELTLRDGAPLIRGEGRVLSFEPADEKGPSSLTLRFTRLDAKSKALVDRAAALREKTGTEPPVPEAHDTSPPGADGADDPFASTQMAQVASPPSEPPVSEEIALSTSQSVLAASDVEEIGAAVREAAPPPGRDSLLDRLRMRAKTLTPSQVATILAARTSTS